MAEHVHDQHHVVAKKIYYVIFAMLMVLSAVPVGVAYIDLGAMNTGGGRAIACFKALSVVLFFMHVKYSTRLSKLTVIAGLYWMGILFVLTFSDYLSRAWGTYSQQITIK